MKHVQYICASRVIESYHAATMLDIYLHPVTPLLLLL